MVQLEHVNVTVRNPMETARWMEQLFGWRIRWEGASIHGGYSVHVGSDDSYVALYAPASAPAKGGNSYTSINGLNHIAVVVDDLDATEKKVIEAGFQPRSHADYEPGRRFYFEDADGLEVEVVSYAV